MPVPNPILVHGALGGPRCWAPFEGRFPGAAAVGLPGHPDGDATADLEEAVTRLVRALELVPGPRALVGHGVGAALCVEAALQRPDLVDGIVGIGLAPELPVTDDQLMAAFTDPAAEGHRLLLASVSDAGTPEALAVAALMEQAGARALAGDYQLCRQVRLHGRLGEVACPVLLIAGGDDAWAPPAAVEALARELPQAIMALVPGARHLVMLDRPATVCLLVAAFLARLELTLDE
ncbi:MAG: alpha/beta hydrolase [Thermoleophilia bacterium]